jgi:hypothetical protein
MLSHKPEQLLYLSRRAYQGSGEQFGCEKFVDAGFTPQEQRIYSKYGMAVLGKKPTAIPERSPEGIWK